jgi:hypothetical protein
MPEDVLTRVARERSRLRSISDALDLDIQFSGATEFRPVISILRKARDEAAEAMTGLVVVPPTEVEKIRELQQVALRFDSIFRWIRELIIEGKQAEYEDKQAERDELLDHLVSSDELEEAEALGLTERTD